MGVYVEARKVSVDYPVNCSIYRHMWSCYLPASCYGKKHVILFWTGLALIKIYLFYTAMIQFQLESGVHILIGYSTCPTPVQM
jgi:hypothetical protein